jgi:hypothetical protein
VVEITESVDDKLCGWTSRTAEERKSFRTWISSADTQMGDHWDVVDESGDTVGSVVLV